MVFGLLVVVWLSWGISYPLTGIALAGFSVMTLRSIVQILGAATLLVQALASGHPLGIEREAWPDLVISGLLNMAIFPIGMTLGVYLMSPGRTSILVYTMAIWATLFARLLLGEALTANRVAAIVLGAAAVVVLVSQDLSHLRDAPLGAALTILAAMSFGLGTVWLKRRQWQADSSVVAMWQLVIGTVPLILIAGVVSPPLDLARVGAPQWLSLLFIGIVANGVAYFAWFRVVRALPAGVTAISALVVPCVSVTASAWITHERLHGQDFVAMGMIGLALVSVLAEGLRRRQPSAAPKLRPGESG